MHICGSRSGGYGVDDTGSESRQGQCLFPKLSDWPWYRGSFPVVKLPGRGVDLSPQSSAEVKNEWRCTSASTVPLLRDSVTVAYLCMSRLRYVVRWSPIEFGL